MGRPISLISGGGMESPELLEVAGLRPLFVLRANSIKAAAVDLLLAADNQPDRLEDVLMVLQLILEVLPDLVVALEVVTIVERTSNKDKMGFIPIVIDPVEDPIIVLGPSLPGGIPRQRG